MQLLRRRVVEKYLAAAVFEVFAQILGFPRFAIGFGEARRIADPFIKHTLL